MALPHREGAALEPLLGLDADHFLPRGGIAIAVAVLVAQRPLRVIEVHDVDVTDV